MRHRPLVLSAAVAGLIIAAATVTAAAARPARPARDTVTPGALATVAPAAARAVVLINGDQIVAGFGTGRRSVTTAPAGGYVTLRVTAADAAGGGSPRRSPAPTRSDPDPRQERAAKKGAPASLTRPGA